MSLRFPKYGFILSNVLSRLTGVLGCQELAKRCVWGVNLFNVLLECTRNLVVDESMGEQPSKSAFHWTIITFRLDGTGDAFKNPTLTTRTVVHVIPIQGTKSSIMCSNTASDTHLPFETKFSILWLGPTSWSTEKRYSSTCRLFTHKTSWGQHG